jgi:hypothetical protein
MPASAVIASRPQNIGTVIWQRNLNDANGLKMTFANYKDARSQEDASSQNREIAEANRWSNAAEGIHTGRVFGHSRIGVAKPMSMPEIWRGEGLSLDADPLDLAREENEISGVEWAVTKTTTVRLNARGLDTAGGRHS